MMGVGVVILTVLVFFVLMKISNKKKNALDPEKFIPFKLIDKVYKIVSSYDNIAKYMFLII